jgi:hypothetical protein
LRCLQHVSAQAAFPCAPVLGSPSPQAVVPSAHPELAWMRAGTQDLEDFRRGSPQAGGKPPLVRSGEETAELMYRSSKEGLVAIGYTPWRYTTYVCGRPVQAFCTCWKPYYNRQSTIRESIV